MQITTRTTDRNALISFLQKETGQRPKYMGAPTFHYIVGPYTVLRNANIETDPDDGNSLLDKLRKSGFADDEEESGISVPFETETVTARMNLLNMVHARQYIISKAIGKNRAFHINDSFLKEMQDRNPQSLQEFRESLLYCSAETRMKGIRFYDDKVVFTGCPEDVTKDEQQAMVDLLTAMVRTSEHQRWAKPSAKESENEKYFFRIWMISLGLNGRKYQKTRNILLERLDGDAAYRTEEQKQKAIEKRKKARAKKVKEVKDHDDFTIL